VRKGLAAPIHLGRIYRVVHETTRRDSKPSLSKASTAQLVQTLSHPNGWYRDTAQRLLVERGDKAAIAPLKTLATTSKDPRARIHALWTLDGNDNIDVPTLTRALADTSRDVRVSAIRIAERWLPTANHPIHPAVLKLLDDPDWAVREQLAASLGLLPAGPRESTLASLLQKHADDPVIVDAALSGLRGDEAAVLQALLQSSTAQAAPAETAITMLSATIMKAAQEATAQNLLTWIADESRPAWQRSALLRGAEIALLNSAMPGSGRRGILVTTTTAAVTAAGAPCPTCPGGRAGPGGAYAFRGAGSETPPATAGALVARGAGGGRGGGGGAAGGPRLRVSREPVALSALAAKGGDLGSRATNVLARIEWPGKPGAAAALPALTADEQKRYDAGSEVYKNICQACHQPDGRGQDRIAPSLVGSTLALAPAEVTSRILLNGKEGPVGLMPPIGMTLNDDQIAGVLTYIRREWGQPGTPVDAATVKAVRALTASRTRPWTNEELLALIPAGRGGGN
jgi:mono/diheme cytochrome c family protein